MSSCFSRPLDRSGIKPRIEELFRSRLKVGAPDDCWVYEGPLVYRSDNTYFGTVSNGSGSTLRANRVAYVLFCEPLKENEFLRAKCKEQRCCNPAHWEKTHADHVVTPEVAAEILTYRDSGLHIREVAKKFNCSTSTIYRVYRRRHRHARPTA